MSSKIKISHLLLFVMAIYTALSFVLIGIILEGGESGEDKVALQTFLLEKEKGV